jgi:acyl-CoA dehydrogenase
MASEHAKTRVVSGSPIGRYQAISHSLADMLVAVEKLRSIIIFAAESHGTQDFEAAVSMAKSTANRAAVDNTQRAIQIFGAKGFQWSFPLNFFLRRSLVGSALFGSTRDHNSHFVSQVTRRQLHGAKLNQDAPSILHLASIAESEKGVSNVSKEVFQ